MQAARLDEIISCQPLQVHSACCDAAPSETPLCWYRAAAAEVYLNHQHLLQLTASSPLLPAPRQISWGRPRDSSGYSGHCLPQGRIR